MDALTLWCNGCRNVTSIRGLDGQTVDLLVAVEKYQTRKVLIAFRRNPAGDQAAEQLTGDAYSAHRDHLFRSIAIARSDIVITWIHSTRRERADLRLETVLGKRG